MPNSFVTIFIYSSPLVVITKTDDEGNWEYVLTKELEDGYHEVYAAVTNNTGLITAQSKPFAFIKEAQAISKIDKQTPKPIAPVSPVQKGLDNLAIFVLAISLVSLFLAIISIWIFMKEGFILQKQ